MAALAPAPVNPWERYPNEKRAHRTRGLAVLLFVLAILLIWGWSVLIKFRGLDWKASSERSLWRQIVRDWQASGEIVNNPHATSSIKAQLQAALQRLQNKPAITTTTPKI